MAWSIEYKRAYHKAWTQRTFGERRAKGLCSCGQPPADGYKRCAKCRALHSNEKTRTARKSAGLCGCGNQPVSGCKQCAICKERTRACMRSKMRFMQTAIFDHYGRKCACCGYDDVRFLTVDHVNNDGAEWRAKGNGQYSEYVRIVASFPDDIQILCMNCNFAKSRFGGVCPHEHDRLERMAACST